jgi:hypothetical protein
MTSELLRYSTMYVIVHLYCYIAHHVVKQTIIENVVNFIV